MMQCYSEKESFNSNKDLFLRNKYLFIYKDQLIVIKYLIAIQKHLSQVNLFFQLELNEIFLQIIKKMRYIL